MKKCNIEGCEREHHSRGYCRMHWRRVKDHGTPGPAEPRRTRKPIPPKSCKVEGCPHDHWSLGFCNLHYQRFCRNGEPGPAELLKAPSGNGCLDANGYRVIYRNGISYMEHRYIMEQHLGRELSNNESVHHRNGNRSDNRIENLELWSKYQPAGQRVSDKIKWAKEILDLYGNDETIYEQ